MRPVNSMIEFKQIVGRGTRLFDGKEFFTIYDFVDAYHHFADPQWDGEPIADDGEIIDENEPLKIKKEKEPKEQQPKEYDENAVPKKVKIKLRNGKEMEIQHMVATSFWGADGKPVSAEEFLQNLFGVLPQFFTTEDELREIWGNPLTRVKLLEKLEDAGYGKDELSSLQKLIDAEKSDIFDVLEYVFNSDIKPITRENRVNSAHDEIMVSLTEKQKEFIDFVLDRYVETGVEELSEEKLSLLLVNKYQSLTDAQSALGDTTSIRSLFFNFQKYLYSKSKQDTLSKG